MAAVATTPLREQASGLPGRLRRQPVLGIKRGAWRSDGETPPDCVDAFRSAAVRVLARDGGVCHFCGFQADRYQEVHHRDGDHTNLDEDNLVTCCPLCHQVHHLGVAAMADSGFLAAIPELTQTEINHLARAVFVAPHRGDAALGEKLRGLYAVLETRGPDTLATVFGAGASLYDVAQALASCTDTVYARREHLFDALRLVPTANAFPPEQLTYYAGHLPTHFHAGRWLSTFHELLG
ncbi:HNH endonuclease [Tahibacter amnicola]|uniref:HNH endonuclease n=1 Tax=Tahibacter amnicola TaxID=2976241 RepID=A0ABY6BE70_9GAMM|nr:HNH endonuclease [Tahibacter amnicola]UXI68331.1 HNH endonuclease [Tahibacter amnicola]